MLNNNFKNWIIQLIGNNSGSSVQQTYKKIDGTTINRSLPSLTSVIKIKTSKIDALNDYGCTFVLGSGTTPATKSDYFVENRIDNSANFSITGASMSNPANTGEHAKATLQQTWAYTNTENPTQEVTITEIGLCIYDNNHKIMMAREVLESPITVKDGDTFNVAMTIGG